MKSFSGKLISQIINSFSDADLQWLEAKIRQMLFKKNIVSYRFASFLNWQIPRDCWNDYVSPWRPSKNDLENYSRALSALDKSYRILILGATPELRDLAASFGFKPVVVDFSLPMMIEMLRYAKNVKVDDEIWVKSDWLSMPIEANFDAVLGDLVLRMVEADRQEEFLSRIKKILSPQGIFVTRMHFVDESLFGLTGDEILGTSEAISNEHLSAYTIIGRILDKFSDLNKNVICRKEAIEFMQDAVKKAKNPREKNIFLETMKFISGRIEWQLIPRKIGWTANNKVQLDNLIGKFFNVADIRISEDYPDSEFYPIYFLRPSPPFNQ